MDVEGNMYVADMANDRVRKINKDGIISTVAGTGEGGYNGDGIPATDARIDNPAAVALDKSNNIYVADLINRRIRKINKFGTISTVVGSGAAGFDGDGGPATAAKFTAAHDIKFDKNGDFYFPDPATNRVRKVSVSGIITTVAGCDESTFGGDGGPATAAGLSFVNAVTIGADGSLLLSDFVHRRIRRVSNVVAINDIDDNGFSCSLFPNPNKGTFTVRMPSGEADVTVSVTDVLGREVASQSSLGAGHINIRLLQYIPGMYLLRMVGRHGSSSAVITVVE